MGTVVVNIKSLNEWNQVRSYLHEINAFCERNDGPYSSDNNLVIKYTLNNILPTKWTWGKAFDDEFRGYRIISFNEWENLISEKEPEIDNIDFTYLVSLLLKLQT